VASSGDYSDLPCPIYTLITALQQVVLKVSVSCTFPRDSENLQVLSDIMWQ
jgi:hypothetical protein